MLYPFSFFSNYVIQILEVQDGEQVAAFHEFFNLLIFLHHWPFPPVYSYIPRQTCYKSENSYGRQDISLIDNYIF